MCSFSVVCGVVLTTGELVYVACICYTIAYLFSPPAYDTGSSSDDQADTRTILKNIFLQANLGLAGHFHQYGSESCCILSGVL